MLLISDGRPYDADYGTEYGVQGRLDYAMHDTRVALEEALLEMESDRDYMVYRDADKQCLSVLVRRRDGNFDLIEG